MSYTATHKPNQLLYGTGKTAICTGWLDRNQVAKKMPKEEYAVIGQLYSSGRGVSFLLRNLLLNPHIRHMVIISATKADLNSGSVQSLLDFFELGYHEITTETGKKFWRINSSIEGYIDTEIPQDLLEKIRKNVQVYFFTNLDNALEYTKFLANTETWQNSKPWGKPISVPLTQTGSNVKPGCLYGHVVRGETVADVWLQILHRIRNQGTLRPTGYDGKMQELVDLVSVVQGEPDEFYFPEPNYLPHDRTFIEEYIPQMCEDAPYREGVKYTYGQRLRSWFGVDQVEQIIQKLLGEIDAASAVMTLWDVNDHERGGSPCLNHIWVRVIDGVLSMTATLRSNDMFGAWCANAQGLVELQKRIVAELNRRAEAQLVVRGSLVTVSQSAHIYDDTFENVDDLLSRQKTKKSYNDPVGNFVIEVKDNQIEVERLGVAGEQVAIYTGKYASKLVNEIIADAPDIQAGHSAYLGLELQKAEIALKSGNRHVQDKKM